MQGLRFPQHFGACANVPHGQNFHLIPISSSSRPPNPRPATTCANLGLRAIGNLKANISKVHSPCSRLIARGLARTILAQPGIEGDPLAFLEVSEAYWRALRHQKHEPQKKGPTVVSYADGPLPQSQNPPEAITAANFNNDNEAPSSSSTNSNQHQRSQSHQHLPSHKPQQLAESNDSPQNSAAQPQSQTRKYDFDVVICGGTLGLFLATALQLRGWQVAIVEKRLVQGRNQEWNISWGELEVLVDLGLLSEQELRDAVVSEFNPIRVGFLGGKDMWTSDVLNLGVQPRRLLEALRKRFLAAGGRVYENTAFRSAKIHTDGLRLKLAPGGSASPLAVGDTNRPNGLGPSPSSSSASSPSPSPSAPTMVATTAPPVLTCRLLLDCMGHYSDIVKQVRGRVKPDGMCMVVGSCAEGFPRELNKSADLLYSLSHARHDMQLFWEAFPAEGGTARTTYMFAYSDAHPDRPSFEQLLDTYFELLPQYQGLPLEQLRFKRVLFGGFPCYSNGPLPPAFDRVMQIGDASAAQSPLSFGGFGSMMRHLGRLTRGLDQALSEDRLSRGDLAWLQPYQPSLSASWLFQRSMSLGVGQVNYPGQYPYTPPYYATAAAAANPVDGTTAAAAAAALIVGAGAGPAAAFQEGIAMAAARFAAGAADPADYFHEEADPDSERPVTAAAVAVAAVAIAPVAAVTAASTNQPTAQTKNQQQQQREKLQPYERDFRNAPEWLRLPYTHVNDILGCNFGVMSVLGDRVLRPFLQDTIQLVPLSLSMMGMMLADPVTVSRVLLQVGPRTLMGWFVHYTTLLVYSLAYNMLRPLRRVVPYYAFQRLLDALEYGSGSDYRYHGPQTAAMAATLPPSSMQPMETHQRRLTATAAATAAASEPELAVSSPPGKEGKE